MTSPACRILDFNLCERAQTFGAAISPYLPFGRAFAIGIAIIAGVLLIIVRFRKARTARIESRLARQQAKEANELRCPHLDDLEIKRAVRGYVVPDCSQVDPANDPEFGKYAQVRERVYHSVDRFFEDRGVKNHLLILADSGVGKTSFCINYYERLRRNEESDVAVLSLARANAITLAQKIPSKRSTLLILDALDEDPAAIQNGEARLYDILSACSEFRGVIVSCRSHFFENDAAIPTHTGISRITPRSAAQGADYDLYRLYLLPFTGAQVRSFLRGQFSILNFAARRKAYDLVSTIPDLSARPMLLALVPELVRQNRRIYEIYDLYEYMVGRWLQRESHWISEDVLNHASNELALYLMGRKQTDGVDRVEPDAIRSIETIADTIEWNHLTTRSLLNRDSEGLLKFAHRSIMEFLTVRLAIAGDLRAESLIWTGFMRELLYSFGSTDSLLVGQSANLTQRLIANRKVTRFPYADPLPEPASRSRAELSYQANFYGARQGSDRTVPLAWRAVTLQINVLDDEFVIVDLEYDLAWRIPNVQSSAYQRDNSAYKLNLAEAFRVLAPGSPRKPSFLEFVVLALADRAWFREFAVIEPDEYYWLGDRLDTGEYLVASLHNNLPDSSARLILSSVRSLGQTSRLNLYALDPYCDPGVRALDITVTRLSAMDPSEQLPTRERD